MNLYHKPQTTKNNSFVTISTTNFIPTSFFASGTNTEAFSARKSQNGLSLNLLQSELSVGF